MITKHERKSLPDCFDSLLWRKDRHFEIFDNYLVLAYTPGLVNEGVFRLVMSLRTNEDGSRSYPPGPLVNNVIGQLRIELLKRERYFGRFKQEADIVNDVPCIVVEWQEYRQGHLLA